MTDTVANKVKKGNLAVECCSIYLRKSVNDLSNLVK